MVGGHLNAFIGDVHRKAINFDTRAKLVAGCFSTREELNVETADAYSIDKSRTYSDYKEMAEKESGMDNGIDFVVICTPNHLHYPVAKTFLEAGINVVCEKPLCFEVSQAKELKQLAEDKDLIFGVTYTYTGYVMPKVMKEMVKNGKIGEIVSVNAEYAQEWLIDELDTKASKTSKFSTWRMDPAYSGIANCVGDIGTHIENMVHYVTGLKIKRLVATTNNFGQELDLNANIIVEYENGANGAYWCSQVAAGNLNGLKVRIYGAEGSLEWEQEKPEEVRYTPKGQTPQILSRGCGYITENAAEFARIPSGHPEGYFVAFANVYRSIITGVLQKKAGEPLSGEGLDFQTVEEGLAGVKFVHGVVSSAKDGGAWVEL
jgi:predicted dehydrogenase